MPAVAPNDPPRFTLAELQAAAKVIDTRRWAIRWHADVQFGSDFDDEETGFRADLQSQLSDYLTATECLSADAVHELLARHALHLARLTPGEIVGQWRDLIGLLFDMAERAALKAIT